MIKIREYIINIYKARYFWLHLVKSELMFKYRRSFFGMLWTLLHPLLLTTLLAIVFGAIFHSPFLQFAPFVYSGITVWDFLIASVMTGSNCIINAEAYIRQFKHPLAIYSLKQALVCTINFMIAGFGLLIWCSVMYPEHILISLIALPISLVFYVVLSWSITTLVAFVNVKFRDFQQFIVIIMQAIWFVSPVYFEPKIFVAAGLTDLIVYNPVTHILNLVRKPLMEGCFPDMMDYLFVIGMILILGILSVNKIKKDEKELIYFL